MTGIDGSMVEIDYRHSGIKLPIVGQASWLVPARVDQTELLDEGAGSNHDAEMSLTDIWRMNRYLGGVRAITDHLYPRLWERKEPITLVDIGAGAAQIDRVVAAWATKQRLDVRILALDLSTRNLAIARTCVGDERCIRLIQADATHLPFRPNSVDYFISSLFLHHLSPEQIIMLLRGLYTIARQGVIISDVTRGWLPLLGFRLGQPIFARSYLTRSDGVISVRRAYTPAEVTDLAMAAGLKRLRIHTHFPWRMTLVIDK